MFQSKELDAINFHFVFLFKFFNSCNQKGFKLSQIFLKAHILKNTVKKNRVLINSLILIFFENR